MFHGSYLMREAITGRPSVTIKKPSRGYQEAIKRPSRGHQEAIKKPSKGHQEAIKRSSRVHQTSSEVGSPKDADQHAISTQSTCHHQTISTYRWALRKKSNALPADPPLSSRSPAIWSTSEIPAHVGAINQQSATISGRQRSSAPISVHQQSATISTTQRSSAPISVHQSHSPAQVGGMPIVRSSWMVGPSERRSAPPGPAPPCHASPGAGGPYVARGSYTLPISCCAGSPCTSPARTTAAQRAT